jgi:Fe-S oxidoreductase
MNRVFAPGCALIIYKPHLAVQMSKYLTEHHNVTGNLLTCCLNEPQLSAGMEIVNICPGCDKRYRNNYEKPMTISLWEMLAESDTFPFPDYRGKKMTILDACPTRQVDKVHEAVRAVAKKMNITIIEPPKTKRKSSCCGDTFYGEVPTSEVLAKMKAKADEMPVDNTIVYCVSCAKSMFNGGKKPRYLIDLLFEEETVPQTTNPDDWHAELDVFIEKHQEYQVIENLGLEIVEK